MNNGGGKESKWERGVEKEQGKEQCKWRGEVREANPKQLDATDDSSV